MQPNAPEASAVEHGPRRLQLIAIAAVLLIALIVGLVSLGTAKPRITGNNGVSPDQALVTLSPTSGPLCVSGVSVAPGSVGVRIGLLEAGGTQTTLTMTTRDQRGRELGSSASKSFAGADQPIFRLPNDARGPVTLCWRSTGELKVLGTPNDNLNTAQVSTLGKVPVAGDISIEYMQAGSHSALSMVPTVFKRASLFRPSWVGSWTFYAVFIGALLALLAGIWMLLQAGLQSPELRKRTLLALAAIAFANAALWALVTPAFNTPDEYAHFTYVETLASGQLPDRTLTPGETGNAYQPSTVLASELTAGNVIEHSFVKEPWSSSAERVFERQYNQLRSGADRRYGKSPADVYTPAYYAPAVVAYKLGGAGSLFDRLLLIRLYSALLFALAVLFTALFVREVLPRFYWAPVVAALAVAFEPMAAHLGGSVTNDNLMVATCAATLWLGARILRHGISFKLALAAMATMVLAYAAKPTALGIAPALALVFLVAIWRSEQRWQTFRTCLLAGIVPVLALGLIYVIFGGGGSVAADPAAGPVLRPTTPTGFLSYFWQWYLPAFGPMEHYFGGIPPASHVFFNGFLADFNSLDTRFPDFIYNLGKALAAGLFVLGLRAIWMRRSNLRASWPWVVYPLAAVLGTAFLINVAGYIIWAHDGSLFAQGRYLFPALAVFGLYVAAAGVGAGKKFALPLVSAVVVALACTNIAGMILSLGRFYL